jgi:hypothetical protein
MQKFKIVKNEINLNWVKNNLDSEDYFITDDIYIVIYYNCDYQKNEIVKELRLFSIYIYNQVHNTNY